MLMTEPLLVSIHIPKTAGAMLLTVFAKQFGDRLQRAYQAPKPGLRRTASDGWPDIANPACIHGHAVFDRFPWVTEAPDARFVVFLREPLAGAVSLWRYKKSVKAWDPAAESWAAVGLEEYLLEEYNHNRYSKWIGRSRRRLEEFFFVGVVERIDESMAMLFRLLGWPVTDYGHENKSEGVAPTVPLEIETLFRERNAEDYAFWQRAQALLDVHQKRLNP